MNKATWRRKIQMTQRFVRLEKQIISVPEKSRQMSASGLSDRTKADLVMPGEALERDPNLFKP